MDEKFKINAYYSKDGEEIEKIISRYLINYFEKNYLEHSNSCKKQL